MKKVVVVMFLLGLAVVSAQAQSPGDRMIASESMKLFATGRQKKLAVKTDIGRNIAKAIATEEAADAKNKQVVAASAEEATKMLQNLIVANPDNKALKEVVRAHNDLITRGGVTGTEEFVAQNMFLGQENLLAAVKKVSAEDRELGHTVAAIINHRYYVEIKGAGYTLQQIVSWAHTVFPHLQ